MGALSRSIVGKVVLAGVGCVGRGDDGFGPILVRRLAGVPCLSTLDCGDRLEDFTGDIAGQRPDTILIVDAVEMGGSPGDVALLEAEDLPLGTGDTHRTPLRTVMEYLKIRTNATVLLLGVQPAYISDVRSLSPQVASSIVQLERIFRAGHGCLCQKHGGLALTGNEHER